METLFENEAHHFGRQWVIQNDDGITVSARLKCFDQWIALFEQEAMVPVRDDISDITFVNYLAVLGQGTSH